MRAVIQRVTHCQVVIEERVHSEIGAGMLVLLGIEEADTEQDIDWLVPKIIKMRIFDDPNGVMNLSVVDCQADILVVSQFTLHAAVKKGNRPSYIRAARPETAQKLYNQFVESMEQNLGKKVKTGVFGADMKVTLCNDGPVTILVDTKNLE